MPAPRLTKKKLGLILDHVRNGMRPGAAGELEGFSREQIFRKVDDDEDFAAAVKMAEREALEHVEEALFHAAASGNVTAARIWLDRKDGPKKSTALAVRETDADEPGFDEELAELNRLAAGRSEGNANGRAQA